MHSDDQRCILANSHFLALFSVFLADPFRISPQKEVSSARVLAFGSTILDVVSIAAAMRILLVLSSTIRGELNLRRDGKVDVLPARKISLAAENSSAVDSRDLSLSRARDKQFHGSQDQLHVSRKVNRSARKVNRTSGEVESAAGQSPRRSRSSNPVSRVGGISEGHHSCLQQEHF
jgi:hypothetical protein